MLCSGSDPIPPEAPNYETHQCFLAFAHSVGAIFVVNANVWNVPMLSLALRVWLCGVRMSEFSILPRTDLQSASMQPRTDIERAQEFLKTGRGCPFPHTFENDRGSLSCFESYGRWERISSRRYDVSALLRRVLLQSLSSHGAPGQVREVGRSQDQDEHVSLRPDRHLGCKKDVSNFEVSE